MACGSIHRTSLTHGIGCDQVACAKLKPTGLPAHTRLSLLVLGVVGVLPRLAAAQSVPQLGTFDTIDISCKINHDDKYSGGVLAGNGRVYFSPKNADNIGELDPTTGVFSTIDISSKINHGVKYHGGVLAGNGRVYFAPRNADNIGDFDPVFNESSPLLREWDATSAMTE